MDNKKDSDSAEQAQQRFFSVLAEIEHKEEILDEDILRLTDLLNAYAQHPNSTEERSGPGNSDSWICGRFASQFRSQGRIQEQEHDQENKTESLREFQGESGAGSVTRG